MRHNKRSCFGCQYSVFKTTKVGTTTEAGLVMDRSAGQCRVPMPRFPVHPECDHGGWLLYEDAVPMRDPINADGGRHCQRYLPRSVPYGKTV